MKQSRPKGVPYVGMRTPWGKADHVTREAHGIWWVGAPGHGGFKLSSGRNRQMPAALRVVGGWYEEDAEFAKVHLGFPSLFSREELELAEQLVRNWFPDEYEAYYQCEILPGHSRDKDKRRFKQEHCNDWLVVAAWGDWHESVPKGQVAVAAERGGRPDRLTAELLDHPPEKKYFLVPADEYAARDTHLDFVIDLQRHPEIDPIQ